MSPLILSFRLPDEDEFGLKQRSRLSDDVISSSTEISIIENYDEPVHENLRVGEVGLVDMFGNSILDLIVTNVSNPARIAALAEEVSSSTIATNSSLPNLLYRHSLAMTIVYCVAYAFVFVVGLVGNIFVIAVVYRSPRMRNVTNFFIVNLAIADILVILFCLPATLMSNIFVPWVLGWWMCKTVPYIQGVSVAASVYSLIAVSLDRLNFQEEKNNYIHR